MLIRIFVMNIVTQCTIRLEINQESGMTHYLMVIAYVVLTLGTELPVVFIISEMYREECQTIHRECIIQRINIWVVSLYQLLVEEHKAQILIHLIFYTMSLNIKYVTTLDTKQQIVTWKKRKLNQTWNILLYETYGERKRILIVI